MMYFNVVMVRAKMFLTEIRFSKLSVQNLDTLEKECSGGGEGATKIYIINAVALITRNHLHSLKFPEIASSNLKIFITHQNKIKNL